MSSLIKGNPWVWVVVQNPGGNERLLAQHDPENDISFAPVFLEKETAQDCFLNMAREKGVKYEVQALLFEDLVVQSKEKGLIIFILDPDGKILEKINPFEWKET
ncbi:MAG: hypothetical protein GY859_14635 [Desulfobacterales bacterium]|nr:hypothetical protein [Desulfobacterales bacterium]